MNRVIEATIGVAATTAVIALLLAAAMHAYDADTCWRLDRQNQHGYPVAVPDYCEAHGYTPRDQEE